MKDDYFKGFQGGEAKPELTFPGLVALLLVLGCIGFAPYPTVESNITTDGRVYNGTLRLPTTTSTIVYCTETIYKVRYTDYNNTYNLTRETLKKIKNMRFGGNSPAQSHGFYECKYQVMEWFGLAPPQFSEKLSILPDWFNKRNDSCLPIRNDNWSSYIFLEKKYWWIAANETEWMMLRMH